LVVGILRFQKWFVLDVLGFQIELCCRYFGLFLTWQRFGLFFEKKLANFFSNLLVRLQKTFLYQPFESPIKTRIDTGFVFVCYFHRPIVPHFNDDFNFPS
jgi:hypothetical protein